MKLFGRSAIILATLSLCVTAHAEHPDRKTKKLSASAGDSTSQPLDPYTAFAWTAQTKPMSNVVPMVLFSEVFDDPTGAAQAMNALPAGRRVGLGFCMTDPMWGADTLTTADGSTLQSPWCDNGIRNMQSAYSDWFTRYTAAGGPQPDFLAMDDEHGFSEWWITAPQAAAIEADPRYTDLAAVCGITGVTPGWYSPTWDNGMAALKNVNLSLALQGLVKNVSNWGDCLVPAERSTLARDLNGCPIYSTTTVGNFQSPSFYGWVSNIALAGDNDGTNPDFKNDLLATVIWQADVMKAMAQSSAPSIPWFASRSYAGDAGGWPVYIANTPYWDEMVFHVLMSAGATNCFTWNPDNNDEDTAALNADMAVLQRKCGNAAVITPIDFDPVPFNSPVMVTGVRAGARRVFRVSVQTVSTKKQVVKVRLPGTAAVSSVTIPANAAGTWVVRK